MLLNRNNVAKASEATMRIPMDQRQSTRYPLCAPVFFSSRDQQGMSRHDEGFTQNISAEGVFILCCTHPLLQTSLDVEILLSPFGMNTSCLRFTSQGRVVRFETSGGRDGFAVAMDSGSQLLRPTGDKQHPLE
jgi:hypothetical protein